MRKSSIRKVLFAAALLSSFCSVHTYALDPAKSLTQYAHRIWDQQEGLLQPTVYSILQTRDGYLWLGTQDSLIRFDGIRFREIDGAPGQSLHRTLVRAMVEDRQGNLWAGTIGGGLVRLNGGKVTARFSTANGFPGANAFCLANGQNDDLWVCATEGMVRMRAGKFRSFTASDGLPTGSGRSTCETPDGTRWVASDGGLARGRTDRFTLFSHPLLPDRRPVNALACEPDGTVWAGTEAGLLRIRDADVQLFTTRDGLPDNTVFTLSSGHDGSLWIGTDDGVTRWRNGSLSVYRTREGLSHSLVLSLFEDREGTLWAGTKNGLDQFTDGAVTPYTTSEGLSHHDAGPLAEDRRGRLWIGTLGGGLNVYDAGRFHAITARNGLLDNTVLSLAVDSGGDIWAGTPRGITRLHGDHVAANYTRSDGLSAARVRALLVDPDGTLWAGTDNGLDRWNGQRFVSSHWLRRGEGVLAMFPGIQVKLFVATETPGLTVVRDGKVTHPQSEVNRPSDCLFLDREQRAAWVGTLGSGLLRWKGNTLAHVRVKDGLYDNRIYAILRDASRNFWLASSKGIFRVSQQELDQVADGRRQFVESLPFSTGQLRFECQSNVQPAAIQTRDGRMWFSTNNGVVMIDPRHLAGNAVRPLVHIDAVLANGQQMSPTGSPEVHLQPAERNVEVRYAGLSFLAPEKVAFRYQLEGFEKGWTDAGNRREAFFTNLPPGHFVFRVMSRNADGLWSGEAAALRFSVAPRLYQRRWFFPCVAVLAALLAFAAYRWRIRQLERTFRLVISERSRIARELHDTLLQGMTGVTMQLQALWLRLPVSREKQWLADIIKDASRASAEARRSLWGLRSVDSPLPTFAGKLTQVVQQAAASRRMEIDLQLHPTSLEAYPELEFQLLRIAGEAATNAAAHALAGRLTVVLDHGEETLRLSVSDNGTGFDLESAQRFGHYGLTGMRERAAEIGGILTLETAPGRGTTVAITVPFRAPSAGTKGPRAEASNSRPVAMHHKE